MEKNTKLKKAAGVFSAIMWHTAFSAIFLLLVSSCGTTETFSCPYVISNPRVEIGAFEDKYHFAGMHFSLFNDSQKNIDSFTFSFMLYDSDGNNPFIGSNCIVSKCEWSQGSDSITDYVISLDSYVSQIPTDGFVIDYLYLREINYSDGTSWKDPYGMFCVREVYE